MSETGTEPRHLSWELPDPAVADNVTYNPTLEELRALAAPAERTTEYGSASFVSDFRSRSADRTKNAIDHQFDDTDVALAETAVDAARTREMVCLDRQVGRHPDATFCCRLYVPVEFARIALAWGSLFEPTDIDDPDFVTVQIPDHDRVAIRVFPDEGFTAVLGSDYTGEAKKSFLRLFMYRAKQRRGLGLHAGSKRVRVADGEGELGAVGQLFLGLSATGKSTLTAHSLWLEEPEEAVMVQDDVVALLPDGSVAGSEGYGLYIKTIGLSPETQPDLYRAATHETAVLENVDVAPDGSVDFDADSYTTNGRAVVRRDCLESATEGIDLDRVDQIFFITRNPLMPPIAKLDDAQAAAAFMLGESIETSAGDPERAGEPIRVVGTNPFIVGSEGEEGNIFQDLVSELDVDCYVINTGYVGEEANDIGVSETVSILTAVARGTVEWTCDDRMQLTVPEQVPDFDVDAFYVPDVVDDYDERARSLREERREYLESFEDLRAEIVESAY